VTAGLSSGTIPSRLQALALWILAWFAMMAVGLGVARASAALGKATGIDAATLGDPATSPVFWSPTWISLGTLANELTLAAVLLVAIWILKPSLAAVAPLGPATFFGLSGAVLTVFGLAPAAGAAAELCHRLVGNEFTAARIVTSAARAAGPAELVLLIVCLALAPALVEEAMFRGFVTAAFARRSMAAALVVPSLMFGLFHLEPTQVAGTIVLGLGFGLARLCTNSLLPAILAHALNNAAAILAARYAGELSEHREIDPLSVLFGFAVSGVGIGLLIRERRRLSFRATEETRAPPPA